MRDDAHISLRTRLRAETSEAHERLDRLLSTLDLRAPEGLGTFLAAQWVALSMLEQAAQKTRSGEMVRILRKAAEDDLASLDHAQPSDAPALDFTPTALALDYLMAGSRLGSAVLRKGWEATEDARVRTAGAYFGAPSYIEIWREVCADAEAIDAADPSADAVIHDTNRLFDAYTDCARQVM